MGSRSKKGNFSDCPTSWLLYTNGTALVKMVTTDAERAPFTPPKVQGSPPWMRPLLIAVALGLLALMIYAIGYA